MFLPGRRSAQASRANSIYGAGSREDLRHLPSTLSHTVPAASHRRLDLDDSSDDGEEGPLRMRGSLGSGTPGYLSLGALAGLQPPVPPSLRSGNGSAPQTPASERSSLFGGSIGEPSVKTLHVSRIVKGTTAKDLLAAFGMGTVSKVGHTHRQTQSVSSASANGGGSGINTHSRTSRPSTSGDVTPVASEPPPPPIPPQSVEFEWRADGSALIHFATSDDAMRAYFAYLGSDSCVGTVTPFDGDLASNSSSSSPHVLNKSVAGSSTAPAGTSALSLSSNAGMQTPGSTTSVRPNGSTSRLKSLGAWMSSDRLSTTTAAHQQQKEHQQHQHHPGVPEVPPIPRHHLVDAAANEEVAASLAAAAEKRDHVATHKKRGSLRLGRRSTEILSSLTSPAPQTSTGTNALRTSTERQRASRQAAMDRENMPPPQMTPLSGSIAGTPSTDSASSTLVETKMHPPGLSSPAVTSTRRATAPTIAHTDTSDSMTTTSSTSSVGRARKFMSSIGARFRSNDSLQSK
ncbi:hypothetical protein PYCC9005_004653 [Savitreella phatthalungensis]